MSELWHEFLRLFTELDVALAEIIAKHGAWTYAILFAIVFAETGLVVTPFLPGDSLLFAAGALAAQGGLSVPLMMALPAGQKQSLSSSLPVAPAPLILLCGHVLHVPWPVRSWYCVAPQSVRAPPVQL